MSRSGQASSSRNARLQRVCRAVLPALTLAWLVTCAGVAAASTVVRAAVTTSAATLPSDTAGNTLLERLPPAWRDDRGAELRLSDLHGRRVFVTMAYSSCHRICPLTMTRLAEIQRELDARGTSAEFLIVSYDPKNDGPDAWRRYRTERGLMRANWHFLTGTPAATQRLARLLGFSYWNYDEHVMHDLRIAALGGDGAMRGAIDSVHRDWQDLL